jgi:hypothetical protein
MRIKSVIEGKDAGGITSDPDVEWNGGSNLSVFNTGSPFLKSEPDAELYSINVNDYPPDTKKFKEAVCSICGFFYEDKNEVDGISPRGDRCILVPTNVILTNIILSNYVSNHSTETSTLTIVYERSSINKFPKLPENILIRRIPFDLI